MYLYFNKIKKYFDFIKTILTFVQLKLNFMLPCYCPGCASQLNVKSLKCAQCGTEVMGDYALPVLLLLSSGEQDFVLSFVKYSGSLKEMANQLKLSYPTVRNRLNEIIEKIQSYEK
jgi:hypothetical protein